MRIAILGAGNVGGAFDAAWASHGHQVLFGFGIRTRPRCMLCSNAAARVPARRLSRTPFDPPRLW